MAKIFALYFLMYVLGVEQICIFLKEFYQVFFFFFFKSLKCW